MQRRQTFPSLFARSTCHELNGWIDMNGASPSTCKLLNLLMPTFWVVCVWVTPKGRDLTTFLSNHSIFQPASGISKPFFGRCFKRKWSSRYWAIFCLGTQGWSDNPMSPFKLKEKGKMHTSIPGQAGQFHGPVCLGQDTFPLPLTLWYSCDVQPERACWTLISQHHYTKLVYCSTVLHTLFRRCMTKHRSATSAIVPPVQCPQGNSFGSLSPPKPRSSCSPAKLPITTNIFELSNAHTANSWTAVRLHFCKQRPVTPRCFKAKPFHQSMFIMHENCAYLIYIAYTLTSAQLSYWVGVYYTTA